ncbi:MAG: methyltransferase domain-containing protein [Elusimicrobia bacterium]|nr:methyltransferase domain-containing protein [Elusimicrobiota bacterium]
MDGLDPTAAGGFGKAADAYERGRPDYPKAAVDLLVEKLRIGSEAVVVDLGAGTGKWTRMLLPTGAQLVAIEPVDEMRAKFGELNPKVLIAPGSAEFITLPTATVDVVTCAQSFHWFQGPLALREIHRVLVPRGGLGLLWNARDESVEWVAQLSLLIDRYSGAAPRYRTGAWRKAFRDASLFTELQYRTFRHVQTCDLPTLLDRVGSISYVAALADGERRGVLEEVRRLVEHHPDTAGKAFLEFPYRTDVYWCFKA